MNSTVRRQALGFATLVGVAALAAALVSPATLVAGLRGLAGRPLALAAGLALVYLVRPFLLWPVTALAVAVGYLYGPVVGVPVALAGTGLSNLPPYLLAHRADDTGALIAPIADGSDRLVDAVGGLRGVLAGRLLPLPGDAVSYAAGLAGVAPRQFLPATVVGEVPWATAAVLAGHSARRLTLSASPSPDLVVGAAALAVLLLAGPAYRRLRRLADRTPGQ